MDRVYEVLSEPTVHIDDNDKLPSYEVGFVYRTGDVFGHAVLQTMCEEGLPALKMGDKITFSSPPE